MSRLLLLFILIFIQKSYAQVDVAFFVGKDELGQSVQLEEGGRFYHMAISYRGKWLHSYPHKGVELADDLKSIGESYVLLFHPTFFEPTEEFVQAHLGKPFGYSDPWNSREEFSCAKLPGVWLGLEPSPMTFEAKYWEGREGLPVGELGLSPDDAFAQLKSLGFEDKASKSKSGLGASACEQSLLSF